MLELPKQAQKMFVCKEEHLVIIAYSTARNLHVKFKKFKEYLPHNYSDFIEYCHPYEQMSITCLFYWKYSDEESFVCLGVRASNGVYHLIIASFEFPSYFKEITVFNFTSPITKICEYSAGKIVLCEGKNLYMITLSLQNPRTLNILMKLSVRNKITSIACDSSQSKIYIGDQKDGVIVVAVSPNSFSVLKNEVKGRAVCSIQNVGNFIVGGDLERNLFVLSENTVQNSLEGLLELTSVKLNDICYQIRRVERRPNISFSSFSEKFVDVLYGSTLCGSIFTLTLLDEETLRTLMKIQNALDDALDPAKKIIYGDVLKKFLSMPYEKQISFLSDLSLTIEATKLIEFLTFC